MMTQRRPLGAFARFVLAPLAPLAPLAAFVGMPAAANAQTDYYNTDRGRPFHIEDAYPVERRAFELQAAPLRLERGAGGVYHWSVEPELAYGILPRTQLEVGVPLSYVDAAGGSTSGVAGVHVSVLHNLNVETSLPALAVGARALLPVGALAPDDPYFSFAGIATRTFTWMRFHVNGEYTVGDEPAIGAGTGELSRWSAGIAMDKTFPLRSLLVGAEFVARQPLSGSSEMVFVAGTGLRYQRTPRWAIDGGIGKHLTGDDRAWYVTFGSAYAFGLPWHP
ncbi:MAG: transporter [Gemmatimonadaceae bacterium]